MMKRTMIIGLSVVLATFLVASVACAGYEYKVNKEHLGGNVTPVEAFKMIKKDPDHTFLVDCRTRAEYQFVGHPEGAYNIPYRFLTTDVGKKGYKEAVNPNFGKDLLSRFNPKTDTLIILCRSGNRSCKGCNEAVKAGWPEDKVFNMMGGFEGGKNKNKASIYYGKRWAAAGNWRACPGPTKWIKN
ncbi:MAG: sulfurtransferase [Desulfobacterales bacterium]|nr:sulfurtransferase [Desulfobacterales bacterium]